MNNLLKTAVTFVALCIWFAPNANAGDWWPPFDPDPEVVFVMVSNADTYTKKELFVAKQTIIKTLGAETADRDRRSAKHRRIEIILTTNPVAIAFSGSPAELYAAGRDIVEMTRIQPGCNDLVRAYANVAHRAKVLQAKRIRIIHIGPFIHAAMGCSADDKLILPQKLPTDIALPQLLAQERVKSFTAYMVKAEQERPLWALLEASGVDQRRGEDGFELEAYTASTTIDKIGVRDALRKTFDAVPSNGEAE